MGGERRLLLVHAHPDDESITTGATMAHYAAQGTGVTLVTCTLGEEGEILTPEFAGLEAAQADQLGGLRIGELAAALRALGVTDHRFLGGAGRFRDSGMMGAASNEHPRAFWRGAAEPTIFAAAVAALVDIIREVRPQVVVTYDDNGDYGHPDHIMAHRVATAAVSAAADPDYATAGSAAAGSAAADVVAIDAPWPVPKFYWTATPRAALRDGFAAVGARPDLGFAVTDVDELGFGVEDDVITTVIDAEAFVDAKRAALRAHRTQVVVADDFFALSNLLGRRLVGVECFRLVSGPVTGVEHDLFAGLDSPTAEGDA